jgi:hypothetical protein
MFRKFIRRETNHGGQIVLWYWQHATNLARVIVFVVCMSSARIFGDSLTFKKGFENHGLMPKSII